MTAVVTALIADDEPLLRDALQAMLRKAWPELRVVAMARNGEEAISMFEMHTPTICFLDIQMPGLSGIEVAQYVARRAHVVFVTAFDDYAVQAFSEGVLDYLVKPVTAARLADTVARLKERVRTAHRFGRKDQILRDLAARLAHTSSSASHLRWVKVQVGRTLRLISVDAIEFMKADSKYTIVTWLDERGDTGEALVRLPLREFVAQLDPEKFVQVHRGYAVNIHAIDKVIRGVETATIYLRGHEQPIPVSRTFKHVFRQM